MSFLNTIDLSPLEQFGKHTPRILRRQLLSQLVEQFIGVDETGSLPVDRERNLNVCKPSIERFHGALLFVDISGFTALSLRLSVEELKKHINDYFSTMLAIVDSHGGDVIKFAGDALFIIWETEQSSEKGLSPMSFEKASHEALKKAVECGKEINAACGNHKVVLNTAPPTPTGLIRMPSMFGHASAPSSEGSPVSTLTRMPSMFGRANASHGSSGSESVAYLNVHSGVSMGLMAGIDIGANDRWEYFLVGEPLSRVAEAESKASTGDMIICPESHDILHGKTDTPAPSVPVEKSSWMSTFFRSPFRLKKDSPKAAKVIRNCGCTLLEGGYCKIDMTLSAKVINPRKTRNKDKKPVEDPRAVGGEHKTTLLYQVEEDIDEVYDSLRPLFLREIAKYEQIKATHHTHHHITSINEEGVKASFTKWASACLMDEVARHVHVVVRSEFSFKNITRVGAFRSSVEAQHNAAMGINHPLGGAKTDLESESSLSRSPTGTPRLTPLGPSTTAAAALLRPGSTPLSPTNRDRERAVGELGPDGSGRRQSTTTPTPGKRPETAGGTRRASVANQGGGGSSVAELRSVTVMFIKIDMTQMELLVDTSKAAKTGGDYRFLAKTVNETLADEFLLKRLQDCIEALSLSLTSHGGQMRQFIVDDKGTVCIGTFGLRGSVSDDNAAAALNAANMIVVKLEALKLNCSIGVTVGKAYCGLVGSPSRHEYAVMGPSTNLSARLMGKAPPQGIICDIETQRRDRIHEFVQLADIKAKGYKEPVGTFKPVFAHSKSPLRRQDTLDSSNTGGGAGGVKHHSDSMDYSEISEDNPVTDKKKLILNWVNSNFYCQTSKEMRLRGRKSEVVKVVDFGFSSLVSDVEPLVVASSPKSPVTPHSAKVIPAFNTTQPARFVGILGVQGIGKTALAFSITNRISSVASNTPSHNIHVFKTRFNSFQVGLPFNAWKPIIVDMLKRIYWSHESSESLSSKPALQRNQRKRNLVGVSYKVTDVLGGVEILRSHLPRKLQKFLPLLGYLQFHKEDKEEVEELGLTDKQKAPICVDLLLSILQVYPRLTKNLVVLTIEDIHTFDSASLDLMSDVYDQNSGIVVIFTGRPQSIDATATPRNNNNNARGSGGANPTVEFIQKIAGGSRYLSVELDNLDSASTTALVTDALKNFGVTEANPQLLRKVHEVSGGNPFYAFEIAKSMSETKEVHIKAISSLHCIRIEEVICYRFDKLNYSAQTMLKMAAVACSHGAPFSLSLIAYISVEDNLSPTSTTFHASSGSNIDAEGGNFTLLDLNFATILMEILKNESFLRVIRNNKLKGPGGAAEGGVGSESNSSKGDVDISVLTVEMIAGNQYLFEFSIPLEQATIYNLLLDDQKHVIHEEIAEYYRNKRTADACKEQFAEEGFHWKRASQWSSAMICFHEAAQRETSEIVRHDMVDSAYAMYSSLREQSISNPELKPRELKCRDLVTLFESAFNYDQEKDRVEEAKPLPNVMTLERVFQIFDGNSLLLKIGLQIHIAAAQKCMSKLQDPVVTKVFLEDAIQMMLLAKNPFLMSSTYVKQLMHNMQNVYSHQLMSNSMVPATAAAEGEGSSKEIDDGMHFYLYSFTSVCLPLLSAYLQNDLYIVTKTSEGGLKNVFIAEKFLALARAESSSPIHTIQALCQLVHIQSKLCNFEKAFGAFEEIAALYKQGDHSHQLIAVYGTDRVPAAFSLVAQGLLLKTEMNEAGMLTKISSELTKKLTHVSSLTVSFVRVASVLVRFGRYTDAHEIVNNFSTLLKEWSLHNKEHPLEKIVNIYGEWLRRREKYAQYLASGDVSLFDSDVKEVDEIIKSGTMISATGSTLVDNLLAWHGRGLESVFADMCAMKIVLLTKEPAGSERRAELLGAYCEAACIYLEHSLAMNCSYSSELLFNKASTVLVASHIIQTLQPLSDGAKYAQIIRNGLSPSMLNNLRGEAEASGFSFILTSLKTLQDHLDGK